MFITSENSSFRASYVGGILTSNLQLNPAMSASMGHAILCYIRCCRTFFQASWHKTCKEWKSWQGIWNKMWIRHPKTQLEWHVAWWQEALHLLKVHSPTPPFEFLRAHVSTPLLMLSTLSRHLSLLPPMSIQYRYSIVQYSKSQSECWWPLSISCSIFIADNFFGIAANLFGNNFGAQARFPHDHWCLRILPSFLLWQEPILVRIKDVTSVVTVIANPVPKLTHFTR